MPLHDAALNGQLEIVRFLIEEQKCDPHAKNNLGRTPLHFASQSGNVDLVKYLVDTHHCDPLSQDDNQAVPLHFAASNGRLEVVKLFTLLPFKFNPQVKNKYTRMMPLYDAARHLEVVRFLIEEKKCGPHARNS